MLVDAEADVVQMLNTTSLLGDFETQLIGRDEESRWLWRVTLDQMPEFPREDFDHSEPRITVYGNNVAANQGKTEAEVVLGHGDNRLTFQTFAIPKTPLTYLLDAQQTPAQQPELDLYVDHIRWTQVNSFFAVAGDDQVYVLREDNEGNSYVQFGDGKTGSRLPSGQNNVVALYRTGIAASGLLEKDKKPSATGKLPSLEKVYLNGEVVGGDEEEGGDNAREAAPGKMQSLGRLVGLSDFEAEALALPGVLKVRADWTAPNGTPLISIVVLTETGSSAAVDKLQQTLNGYNRCRGPARFPIKVEQGLLQYMYLNARVGYAAAYRQADIEVGVKLALGLVGEESNGIETDQGLFSLALGHFGQSSHRSKILAAIQSVVGVTWVEIDDAQAIDLSDPAETDPIELASPLIVSTAKAIACSSQRILALHSNHLDLSLVHSSDQGAK
jgi:predicted phage baseplate assembly protein